MKYRSRAYELTPFRIVISIASQALVLFGATLAQPLHAADELGCVPVQATIEAQFVSKINSLFRF